MSKKTNPILSLRRGLFGHPELVTELTCNLLRLLFPGFFDEKLIHSSEIKVETAALLDSVLGTLEDEIRKSLEYKSPEGLAKKDIPAEAQKITMQFLESLPRVREILQTDVQAAFDGDPAAASKEEIIVSYPFVEAISVQRLAHELYKKDIALIPRIMAEWAHARTGMDLHPGAQIGSHFFVDHGTGTVGRRNGHHRQPCEDVSRRDTGREIDGGGGRGCAARNGTRPSRTA